MIEHLLTDGPYRLRRVTFGGHHDLGQRPELRQVGGG
jgi:hypothetical protein